MTLEEKVKNAQHTLSLEKDTLKAIFEQSVIKASDTKDYFDPESYVVASLQDALEEINKNILIASKTGFTNLDTTLQYTKSEIDLDFNNMADTIAIGLRDLGYKVKYDCTEGEDEDTGEPIYTLSFNIEWDPFSKTSVNVYKEPLCKDPDRFVKEAKEDVETITRSKEKKSDAIDPVEKLKKYKADIAKYKEELAKKLSDSNIEDELYKTLLDTTCKGYEMSKELVDELTKVFKK